MINAGRHLPLLRIYEDKEVLKSDSILKIGNALVSSQRGVYDTPKKITTAFLNMYKTWIVSDSSDEKGCQFCNLDLIEADASFLIRVADHYERSPASIDAQKEFMKRGFLVLTVTG